MLASGWLPVTPQGRGAQGPDERTKAGSTSCSYVLAFGAGADVPLGCIVRGSTEFAPYGNVLRPRMVGGGIYGAPLVPVSILFAMIEWECRGDAVMWPLQRSPSPPTSGLPRPIRRSPVSFSFAFGTQIISLCERQGRPRRGRSRDATAPRGESIRFPTSFHLTCRDRHRALPRTGIGGPPSRNDVRGEWYHL